MLRVALLLIVLYIGSTGAVTYDPISGATVIYQVPVEGRYQQNANPHRYLPMEANHGWYATRSKDELAKGVFTYQVPKTPQGQKLKSAKLKMPMQKYGETQDFGVKQMHKRNEDGSWFYHNMKAGKKVTNHKKNKFLQPGGEIDVTKHIKRTGSGKTINFGIQQPKKGREGKPGRGYDTFASFPQIEYEYE
jgi:hypothetical protein